MNATACRRGLTEGTTIAIRSYKVYKSMSVEFPLCTELSSSRKFETLEMHNLWSMQPAGCRVQAQLRFEHGQDSQD